jgi:pantoate--beta-alanine ligase
MGNLHQGHLSLIELAKQEADIIVSSIFVNPMQFGENEDLDSYPRTLEDDIEKLKSLGVHYLFTPNNDDIYPLGKSEHSSVEVARLSNKLCGISRPVFFKGIATVVSILFNIVQPTVAVFGKKDYQQFRIIQAMTKDLMFPIKIIGGETIRETSGLAMSSRNNYLTDEQKQQACLLRQTILSAEKSLKEKQTDIKTIQEKAKQQLIDAGFEFDYFDIIRQSDLQPAKEQDKELLIAAACWLNGTRLIDNIEVL